MKNYTAIDAETQLDSLIDSIMNETAKATLDVYSPKLNSMLPELNAKYGKRIDAAVCELAACLEDRSALDELAACLSPMEIVLINYRVLLAVLFFRAQPASFSSSLPEEPAEFFVAVLNGVYSNAC